MSPRRVEIASETVFGDGTLGLIAGPCVIEGREHCRHLAECIGEVASALRLPWVFKASFDKANRTSASSFRGPGLEEGLEVLAEVRERVGVPVLTDVHLPEQAVPTAEVADVLQIPAFLCRQTDLVEAAAATGRVLNIKKGQFLAPWDLRQVVDKAERAGNRRLLLTERGTSFGYNNLVVDFKGLCVIAELGYPVVFDVTHSLQLPASGEGETGGERRFAEPLAAAGAAAGVDVLFLEVHDDPANARSDAATQLPLERLRGLLERALRAHASIHPEEA